MTWRTLVTNRSKSWKFLLQFLEFCSLVFSFRELLLILSTPPDSVCPLYPLYPFSFIFLAKCRLFILLCCSAHCECSVVLSASDSCVPLHIVLSTSFLISLGGTSLLFLNCFQKRKDVTSRGVTCRRLWRNAVTMVAYNGWWCKPTRSSNYIKLLIFLINIFLVNFSVCVVTFQVLIF